MDDIFKYESQDIDLKESIKLRINCEQLDTVVLQFSVYDYDIPVNLANFNIEFRAIKSDGTFYSQVKDIEKIGNLLTITCNNQLTSVKGRVNAQLRVFDNENNQKSSYFIVLNVSGIVSDEDRVVSRNLVDILEHFDEDINIAMKLSTTFSDDIEQANILDKAFQSSIANANTLENAFNVSIDNASKNKTALDNSNTTALDTKSALDISNTNAVNTNTMLNNTIDNANTVKSNLDLDKANVNSLNDTLITTIANADTKLQDFKNYDTTQLVPLSNTMLNEMYCNNELLSINHGLNNYPIVQLIYTEYGAGIGGAGDFPAGANSENLMQNKTVYTDKNNITIYVPNNYYISNSIIEKIDNYTYIITFENSTRSILIKLKL